LRFGFANATRRCVAELLRFSSPQSGEEADGGAPRCGEQSKVACEAQGFAKKRREVRFALIWRSHPLRGEADRFSASPLRRWMDCSKQKFAIHLNFGYCNKNFMPLSYLKFAIF
jgi:hypothetical protein